MYRNLLILFKDLTRSSVAALNNGILLGNRLLATVSNNKIEGIVPNKMIL